MGAGAEADEQGSPHDAGLTALEEELDRLAAENAELSSALQRARADLVNERQRHREELVRRAAAAVAALATDVAAAAAGIEQLLRVTPEPAIRNELGAIRERLLVALDNARPRGSNGHGKRNDLERR